MSRRSYRADNQRLFASALCAMMIAAFVVGESRSSTTDTGTLSIAAALVDRDMNVRPVPLHPLVLLGDLSDTVMVRTGIDGKLTVTLPAGHVRLVSRAGIAFAGEQYRWQLEFDLRPGDHLELALTNDNATHSVLELGSDHGPMESRVAPASELFERLQHSIFRVEAGLAHGTGFLVDTLDGVILTNAHVVEAADSTSLSIRLASNLRVRAQLLARDSDADIAVLRVHPSHLGERARIPLQNPGERPPVVPGETLLAMGYPLHQELTITSGIASSVRAGAIISDVNINPGNSGGPLLNLLGEAVAVNTFGDVADRGAGVSGSLLVSRAGPAFAQAAIALRNAGRVDDDSLPTLPEARMSVAALKAYADTTDLKRYRGFSDIDLGGFGVNVRTPAQIFVAIKAYENVIARDRKKREAKAGLSEAERYSEVRELRDWVDYVGPQTTPVVAIAVIPRVGETGGSVFARIMISPQLQATYKFQGDVRGVWVYRNGELVEPIMGGHAPTKVFVDNSWVSLKDVADQGFYVFDPELLRPDTAGVAPSIVVTVRDLKSPKKLKCRELPADVIALAWNDFAGFYRSCRPQAAFKFADVKGSLAQQARSSRPYLGEECSWYPY